MFCYATSHMPGPATRRLRLLVDSVPVGSPGILQLRDEFARVFASGRHGGEVVLLAAGPEVKPRHEGSLTVVPAPRPPAGWAGRWWWYHHELPRLVLAHRADVVFSMSGILSPRLRRTAATVTTVNNMLPFTPDSLRVYPAISTARVRLELLRRLYVSALKTADAVVLHSQHALDSVTPYAGDITSKTVVALTGVPTDLRGAQLGAHPRGGEPYIFYFSAFYPYKNHLKLLAAYQQALAKRPTLPKLVLAGIPADVGYRDTVVAEIERLDLQGRVEHLGTLERTAIPTWLSHATVNVFASTCETNPVTIAEILALGGALMCSAVPPMTEIAGDAAATFDPESVESIATTMVALLDDPARRDQLRQRALHRAGELSWEACTDRIWEAALRADAVFRGSAARSE